MTPTKQQAVKTLTEWREHAPTRYPEPPADLLGWRGPDVVICARCAARIMARGCSLETFANVPTWADGPALRCDLCEPEIEAFDPAQHVQIAADSVEQLRRADVGRLFDQCEAEHWAALADFINLHRADLADEVQAVISELEAEREQEAA